MSRQKVIAWAAVALFLWYCAKSPVAAGHLVRAVLTDVGAVLDGLAKALAQATRK